MLPDYSDDELLTDKEYAKLLKISEGTPAVWRARGCHPTPYIKIGKLVRHKYGVVKEHLRRLEVCDRVSTFKDSEYPRPPNQDPAT